MFPTKAQYRRWSLPTKWGFWSAFIGIPLALISLGAGFLPLLQFDTSDAGRKELVFKTAQELRYNREFLTALAQASRQKASNLPIGKINTDSLVTLTEKYYGLITEDSRGEQKHLYRLSLQLRHLGEQISLLKTPAQLRDFQRQGEWSMDDVVFL